MDVPNEILTVICLKMDYDDLILFSITSHVVHNMWENNIFWLDKIYHDFGENFPTNSAPILRASYIKLAAYHIWSIDGIEKYVYSCRDLCRLIFKSLRVGKPTDKLWKKLNLYDLIISGITGQVTDTFILAQSALLYDDLDLLKDICPGLTSHQIHILLNIAAMIGNGDSFQYLYNNSDISNPMRWEGLLQYIITLNNLELLKNLP